MAIQNAPRGIFHSSLKGYLDRCFDTRILSYKSFICLGREHEATMMTRRCTDPWRLSGALDPRRWLPLSRKLLDSVRPVPYVLRTYVHTGHPRRQELWERGGDERFMTRKKKVNFQEIPACIRVGGGNAWLSDKAFRLEVKDVMRLSHDKGLRRQRHKPRPWGAKGRRAGMTLLLLLLLLGRTLFFVSSPLSECSREPHSLHPQHLLSWTAPLTIQSGHGGP